MKRITDYKDDNGHDHNNNNKSSTFRYLCTIKELSPGRSRQFSLSNDKGTKKIQIALFNVMEDSTVYRTSASIREGH